VNHYNTQPVSDVYAAVDGRDLGGVAGDVDRVIATIVPSLPKGRTSWCAVRSRACGHRSWSGLGVLFAMLLVYLLLVINSSPGSIRW